MGIGHSKVKKKNNNNNNRHIIVEDNGARDTVVKSQIIVPFLLYVKIPMLLLPTMLAYFYD